MKDVKKENKPGRYSFYIGLGALIWWLVIFAPSLINKNRVASDAESIKSVILGLMTALMNIIGFVLGIIGLLKKNTEKRYAAFGVLINGPIILITVLFILIPVIIGFATGQWKHVPDEKEITTRFGEVLVQPSKLQGIEAWGSDGSALFKYYTQSSQFIEDLERQASAKGWAKVRMEKSIIDFARENHMKRDNKIILFQYEQIRLSHNDKSGLICVGYDRILSPEKIGDLKNTDSAKVIETISWSRHASCAAGN